MEIVSYIVISQSLFAILLTASKKPLKIQDKVLIAMLITISWIILGSITRSAKKGETFFAMFNLIPFTLALLPLLYLYVRTALNQKPKIFWNDLIHFIIPAIYLLGSILYKPMYSIEVLVYNSKLNGIEWVIITLICFIFLSFYAYKTILLVRKHQKELSDNYSFTSPRISFNWIKLVIVLFVINFLLSGLGLFINKLLQDRVFDIGLIFFLNLGVFSFAISYFGFFQPSLFHVENSNGIVSNRKKVVTNLEIVSSDSEKVKYKKSNLTPDKASDFIEKMICLLTEERLYLQHDLTIQVISDKLNIPKHYLTESLNTFHGKNFYTLINEYRVLTFKELVNNKKYEEMTILGLALESGFNSKSSFNNVFKKHTGFTPSQYLKSVKEKYKTNS
jgi:AraC-like DNA-binding protein